ncbi:MAG: S49 family peptidase [Gammaproteobacteria bacterium]|nr:S49 family peptidase [Gammaproteobacteria bacterium]
MDKDENASKETSGPEWERNLLERLAFASLNEQRRARRWSIGFKLFFAGYLVLSGYLVLLFVIASTERLPETPTGEFTALVDMEGIIAPNMPASADYVVDGLRGAFESKAKGVILRTNSPGGSPVQAGYISDEINRLREKYPKKPFYAVVGDICASGCYYAVAAADKIFVNQASIVGSIGVLMDGFGFVDSLNKLGIERRLMTAGDNKAILDPFSPVNPSHKAHVQKMLNEIHQQFIEVVKEGRGQALKDGKEIFSGLLWTGEKAVQLGLVDELGSAGYVAREVIGAEKIVDFTYRENLLDRFAQRLGTTMAHTMGAEILGSARLR